MKFIYAAGATLAILFTSTFILPMQKLHAEDVIQMNNNQEIIMSGTITEMDNHNFTLNSGSGANGTSTATQVSTDSLATASSLTSLLKNGMKVTVRGTMGTGTFHEPLIRATNISAYQESAPAPAPAAPGTNAAAGISAAPATAGSTGATPGAPATGAAVTTPVNGASTTGATR